jgi:hypothetical protein
MSGLTPLRRTIEYAQQLIRSLPSSSRYRKTRCGKGDVCAEMEIFRLSASHSAYSRYSWSRESRWPCTSHT